MRLLLSNNISKATAPVEYITPAPPVRHAGQKILASAKVGADGRQFKAWFAANTAGTLPLRRHWRYDGLRQLSL